MIILFILGGKKMKYYDEFVKGNWCKKIDVENFIELNYKEYLGDEKFLCKSTPKTNLVMIY